jgi:hypothetical protein
MPETVFGLPTHALLVHATVVLVPLAALVVVLHAVWPTARARLGIVTPLLAVVALVLTPLSTQSGENLEHSVGHSQLIERHAELADGILPWTLALAVVGIGVFLLFRTPANRRPRARWIPLVATVLAVLVSVGTVQQVVRAGHAGAKATWDGVIATTP